MYWLRSVHFCLDISPRSIISDPFFRGPSKRPGERCRSRKVQIDVSTADPLMSESNKWQTVRSTRRATKCHCDINIPSYWMGRIKRFSKTWGVFASLQDRPFRAVSPNIICLRIWRDFRGVGRRKSYYIFMEQMKANPRLSWGRSKSATFLTDVPRTRPCNNHLLVLSVAPVNPREHERTPRPSIYQFGSHRSKARVLADRKSLRRTKASTSNSDGENPMILSEYVETSTHRQGVKTILKEDRHMELLGKVMFTCLLVFVYTHKILINDSLELKKPIPYIWQL